MTIITAEWRAMTILTLSLSCKRDLILAMHHQLPKNDELGRSGVRFRGNLPHFTCDTNTGSNTESI